MELCNLTDEQIETLENKLEQYDAQHMGEVNDGRVSIGWFEDGRMVAGLDGQMTSFHIFYISTVFVEETHRRKGLATRLLAEAEKRAVQMGANMLRLDTFDWQGKEFYEAIGFTLAGSYRNEQDRFGEFFFYKMIG